MQGIVEHKYFKTVINGLAIIVALFSATKMVLNLCYVSESLYQTIRNRYFWCAAIYCVILLIIVNKTKIINWKTGLYSIISISIIWLLLRKWKEMPDLYYWYRNEYIAVFLGGVLLLDLILSKKIILIKNKCIWMTVLYLVCTVLAFIIAKGKANSFIPLVLILFFLIVNFSERQWSNLFYYISIGYYIAFAYTMLKSFITVPYTGARYYGIFINHGMFGIFVGGAFICAFYWLLMEIKKEKKRIPIIVVSAICLIFAFVCQCMVEAKVSLFAVIAFPFFVIPFFLESKKQKQIYWIVATTIMVFGTGIVFVTFLLLKNQTQENLQAMIPNQIIYQKVRTIFSVVRKTFFSESKWGIIEGGTLLNALDWFSSGRISYWIVYLSDLNMFGHESVAIQTDTFFAMHPHNTYIYWLHQYGVLSGVGYIVLFFSALIESVRRILRKQKINIFSFMWLLYCALVFVNEVELWTYQIGFIMLICMSSLCFKNYLED